MSQVHEPASRETLRLSDFYRPIVEPLSQVEQILQREMQSDYPAVGAMTGYGFRMGGKRLRPALLLLTARALGEIQPGHLVLAAVVEMIHTATLVHDDVLDGADVRRHRATVNRRWGNRNSILLGDYLFSHAFYLASTLESTFACRLIGRATNKVCEGEIRQNDSCGKWELSEDEYYSLIDAKTAELCACCCELGAYYAGAGEEAARAWGQYGRRIGMAFQIIDDILDMEGRESETGKSLGTDLAQQKPTLPTIHVVQQTPEGERASLLELLRRGAEAREELEAYFRQHGAFEYARSKAREFAEEAVAIAATAEPGDARDVLEQLPLALLARNR